LTAHFSPQQTLRTVSMVLSALRADLSHKIQTHTDNSFVATNSWNGSLQKREKNILPLSNSLTVLADSCFSNLIRRTSFEKLVETNKLVTAALIENTKRSRDDDLEVSAAVPSGLGTTGSSALSFSPLSRSDFPLIKFWTKEDWDSHKSLLKDTSGAKGKGPERSSRGVNTRALYMENEDGTPISGATVGQMRAVARMVWIELFDRGKAPSSWGKASLEARNLYHSELESRWAFLRLCENHWKVDALATANYSQWYLAHKAKMASIKAAKDSGVSQARAPKRAKTAVEEDDDSRNVRSEFTADPDDFGSLRSETPFEDLRVGDNQTSEAEDEVLQELGNILPRPKARPLRDPL
jgi:hypothetical protein